METYHKINGLYKRDDKGNFTQEFAQPEFGYLFNNTWVGTEKIDGTNIRIHWDGKDIEIRGRTNNADIPAFLMDRLNTLVKEMNWNNAFPPDVENPASNVILFGEGYGAKIQKGGGDYIPNGNDFILFDVKIGSWWMKREAVDEIATKLGIKSVPVLFRGPLWKAIEMVKYGFDSTIGTAKAEGLVLVPEIDLFARNGSRIITKLKVKDF